MADSSRSDGSGASASCPVDQDVLNGDVCVKCGFKCIEGCS
jgi:hypothetical protein